MPKMFLKRIFQPNLIYNNLFCADLKSRSEDVQTRFVIIELLQDC